MRSGSGSELSLRMPSSETLVSASLTRDTSYSSLSPSTPKKTTKRSLSRTNTDQDVWSFTEDKSSALPPTIDTSAFQLGSFDDRASNSTSLWSPISAASDQSFGSASFDEFSPDLSPHSSLFSDHTLPNSLFFDGSPGIAELFAQSYVTPVPGTEAFMLPPPLPPSPANVSSDPNLTLLNVDPSLINPLFESPLRRKMCRKARHRREMGTVGSGIICKKKLLQALLSPTVESPVTATPEPESEKVNDLADWFQMSMLASTIFNGVEATDDSMSLSDPQQFGL